MPPTPRGRRTWIAHVAEVPAGFIQVDHTGLIDVIYVEPSYRGPALAVADRLVASASRSVTGLCHDGHQSVNGRKLTERLRIPTCPDARFEVWQQDAAKRTGRAVWLETCRTSDIALPG